MEFKKKYKIISFNKNIFSKKNYNQIINLLKSCFSNLNLSRLEDENNLISFLSFYDSFIVYNFLKKSVVALCLIGTHECIKITKSIQPYKILKLDDGIYKKITKKEKINLYPFLIGLCRNKKEKYKGLGNFLLDYVCNYFKMKKEKFIYLVPESVIYRNKVDNENYNYNEPCGIEIIDQIRVKKYLESQNNLLKYYLKKEFKIYKNYYIYDICAPPNNKNSNNPIIFFNVLRKGL